jgi:serine/threonine protein phosphatase PrpC
MLKVSGKQSVGKRDNQEDAFKLVFQNEQDPASDLLMVLSDGMGGHAGGEVASTMACKTFAGHFVGKATASRPRARLEESLHAANTALGAKVKAEPALRGMGCTLIGALKMENRLIWVSVGDSILFLLRQGKLKRLNADHSLYGELLELVRAGKLTQKEADSHPRRNALRSAVMGEQISLVDTDAVDLQDGDHVLIATDGLETLSDGEIRAIMTAEKRPDVRALCSDLLNAVEAKAKPSQDNTTVVIYSHRNGGRSTLTRASQWSLTGEAQQSRKKVPLLWYAISGIVAIAAVLALLVFATRPAPVVVEPPTAEETAPETVQPSDRDVETPDGTLDGNRSIIDPAPAPETPVDPDAVAPDPETAVPETPQPEAAEPEAVVPDPATPDIVPDSGTTPLVPDSDVLPSDPSSTDPDQIDGGLRDLAPSGDRRFVLSAPGTVPRAGRA